MILYHFTSNAHIDGVIRNGLVDGVIPRTMTNYLQNYQWLTKNPDWFPLWAAGLSAQKYYRTEHRITIEIPKNRYKNLMFWPEAGPRLVPLSMYNTLNSHDDPNDWYIYHGMISPRWFTDIQTRDMATTGQRDNSQV